MLPWYTKAFATDSKRWHYASAPTNRMPFGLLYALVDQRPWPPPPRGAGMGVLSKRCSTVGGLYLGLEWVAIASLQGSEDSQTAKCVKSHAGSHMVQGCSVTSVHNTMCRCVWYVWHMWFSDGKASCICRSSYATRTDQQHISQRR